MSTYDDLEVFEEYIKTRGANASKHNSAVRDNLIKMVGDVKDKSVLDLGCGIGEFSKYFADNDAKKIVAVDISKRAIDYAEEHNNHESIDYRKMDIDDISTLDEMFDLIFSDMVFNYLKDYNKVLKDAADLLTEDGIVVFSQVHPLSTASFGMESSWQNDEDGNLNFLINHYSDTDVVRKKKYFNGVFNFYHRRFEDIINGAYENGFVVSELLEPYATEKELNRPSFLLVKLEKRRK